MKGRFHVAFTGAQGSGKSTCSRAVATRWRRERRSSCSLLEGIGQAVQRKGYLLGDSANEETIWAFAAEHLLREKQARGLVVFQDRCFIDLIAYARVTGAVADVKLLVLERVGARCLRECACVFYLPLQGGLPESRSRVETSDLRIAVDREIAKVAADVGVRLRRLEGVASAQSEEAFRIVRTVVGRGKAKA